MRCLGKPEADVLVVPICVHDELVSHLPFLVYTNAYITSTCAHFTKNSTTTNPHEDHLTIWLR